MQSGHAVSFPLYKLPDISQVRLYNYDKPTLTDGNFTDRVAWQESSTFWKAFLQSFPIFEYIDLEGIAIFGGAIVDLMLKRNCSRDVDLAFICDRSDNGNALAERVEKIVNDIVLWILSKQRAQKEQREQEHEKNNKCSNIRGATLTEYTIDNLLVTRYKDVYEIRFQPFLPVPIQISIVDSLDTLLSDIDIGCTAICYFGKEILMQERAKTELENLAITVDTQRQSTNYFDRLVRYHQKGFDIILSDLDISLLPKRNLQFEGGVEIIQLPFLLFFCNKLIGNKIFISDLRISNLSENVNTLYSDASCMYDWASGQRTSEISTIIHDNLCKIANDDTDNLTYFGEGENFRVAFKPDILLTERQVINTYDTLSKKIYNDGSINLSLLDKYFPHKNMEDILKEVFVCFAGKKKGHLFDDDSFNKKMKEYIPKLVDQQVIITKHKLAALSGKGSLLITKKARPVESLDDKKRWYGEFLNLA